ncbi:MAG: cation acetate symporter, partial [Planctomycetales bacterium]|nr:cation acetate symporter [Planctomycetales bacterium]
MLEGPSTLSLVLFAMFVGVTLGLSLYLGRRAKSSEGYFAAHGQIPWFVNGVAFAGDYLSAASFLGICGMIAFYGYDGFLYSIGYLAGWIVALFVVAEPMKKLGKFTFADALDAKFGSRGIRFAAGVSTLVVSVFYLIPQMVGAGALVQPLLALPHWAGVIIVGAVVVFIVLTAGMVSTTWVQFIKGGLLVVFSAVLTLMILNRGLSVQEGGNDGYKFGRLGPFSAADWESELTAALAADSARPATEILAPTGVWEKGQIVRLRETDSGATSYWALGDEFPEGATDAGNGRVVLRECQSVVTESDGRTWINGTLQQEGEKPTKLHRVGQLESLGDDRQSTGPLGPTGFLAAIQQSTAVLWRPLDVKLEPGTSDTEATGTEATVIKLYVPKATHGTRLLRPGEHPTFAGIRSEKLVDKLNFLSLMIALFGGTASLPH